MGVRSQNNVKLLRREQTVSVPTSVEPDAATVLAKRKLLEFDKKSMAAGYPGFKTFTIKPKNLYAWGNSKADFLKEMEELFLKKFVGLGMEEQAENFGKKLEQWKLGDEYYNTIVDYLDFEAESSPLDGHHYSFWLGDKDFETVEDEFWLHFRYGVSLLVGTHKKNGDELILHVPNEVNDIELKEFMEKFQKWLME